MLYGIFKPKISGLVYPRKSLIRTGLFPWIEQAPNKLKLMSVTLLKRTEHPEQLIDPLLDEQFDDLPLAEQLVDPPLADQLDDPPFAENLNDLLDLRWTAWWSSLRWAS